MTRTINLITGTDHSPGERIPASDPAPWRKALGYPWADYPSRTLGEDIATGKGVYDAIIGELRADHGAIVVVDDRDRIPYDRTGRVCVARITCMWCGGLSVCVYTGQPIVEPTREPEPDLPRDPNLCPRCDSYCYGDCTASQE